MAELADALDLGSSGRPCRFDSCYPQVNESLGDASLRLFFLGKRGAKGSVYMGERNIGRSGVRAFR